MKKTFENPNQARIYLAQQNEAWMCYEAAARLYREAGDEDSAKRCDEQEAQSQARKAAREKAV